MATSTTPTTTTTPHAPAPAIADLQAYRLGSIITLEAKTRGGRVWLRRHVPTANPLGVTYCDPRMGIEILQAAYADGLRVLDLETGRITER